MRQLIRNLPLKRKIHSIVFCCIILMIMGALISIRLICSAYDQMLYKTTAASLSISSTEMLNCLENINTMADMFLADSTIQRNLGKLKDSQQPRDINTAYQATYTALMEYYFTFRKNHINFISVYQDDFSIHTHMPSLRYVPDDVKEQLAEKAIEAKGASVWVTDYSKDHGLFMVKAIRRTENLKLDTIGVLVANIDLNGLITEANGSGSLQQESAYLLYDKEHLIYGSPTLSETILSEFSEMFDSPYGLVSYSDHDFFYVKSQIPGFGWNYVCIIPYDNIMVSIHISLKLCLAVLLSAVIVSILLSSALIDSITRHFDNLLLKMKNFGDGNQEPVPMNYDYSTRTDELGILHVQFDHMVEEVNKLIRTNYLNELLIKEAQFKALENQMNPHFLYNTLESINWRAKIAGARDISAMAEALGTLLRITLDQKHKQVPLARELELVRCYMTIQKYRYEERLTYQIQVPETLMNCSVLKFTLQPLVENAIRYGLEENTDSCLIQIIAEADQERHVLLVYVKNNGSVFEENLLDKLTSHEIEPHGFGIGLMNIQNRMQLTFGEPYGLKLYNEEDLAVAQMTYPLTDISKGASSC